MSKHAMKDDTVFQAGLGSESWRSLLGLQANRRKRKPVLDHKRESSLISTPRRTSRGLKSRPRAVAPRGGL